MAGLIALLSDFGTSDWYVASMKGVLLSIAPRVQLVDITHEIPPQDITVGALTLVESARWFPAGTTFLAVVDPGVGTDRALLAVEADGRRFLGPDNGLLGLVIARAKRCRIAQVTNRALWRSTVSPTFHGRDILAPVAARLALGTPLARVGRLASRWQPTPWPSPVVTRTRTSGLIVAIDHFGTAITNLPEPPSRRSPKTPRLRVRRRSPRVVSSYTEGRNGELIALIGSHGYWELAVRNDSASRRFQLRRGDRVMATWT